MRSHRRRSPVPHVLLVGTAAELETIEAALRALPDDAYGQVLIEDDTAQRYDLGAPERVTVHRVAAGAAKTAAAAWAAEWLPTPPEDDREVGVWVTALSSARELPTELTSVALTI